MAGPINWFSQIGSITKFGLLSLPQRRGAVAATVIGIAGVVAVLVGVLSIAAGFRQAMTVSGSPDGAIVLRSGADSEMVSGLGRTKPASLPTRRASRARPRARSRPRNCSSSLTCPSAPPARTPTCRCAAWNRPRCWCATI